MTKRIFRTFFLMTAVLIISCLITVMWSLYDHYSALEKKELRRELRLTAKAVENEGVSYLQNLDENEFRITWINNEGKVLFDSVGNVNDMENHADREEIKQAMSSGAGECQRKSATLTENTYYYAIKLKDETILRISVNLGSFLKLVDNMVYPVIAIFIVALLLSYFLSKWLSKKIVMPLNLINLNEPLENNTYDEISPLLNAIDKQQKEIAKQKEKLDNQRSEFGSVINNMTEGLVLLNKNKRIISINTAAKKFFEIADTNEEKDYIDKFFIELDRTLDIGNAIDEALNSGKKSIQINRKGLEYQVNISRIISENGLVSGAVILIFDVSDRVFAERNRKEFTANVSHELKTPLQAIIGSAELIENKLVKQEDIPEFAKRIHNEGTRMVTLIEDIIKLSSLDEHITLDKEDVDLYELAEAQLKSLQDMAENKNLSLNITGEHVKVHGVRTLLYDIVANLCTNACKYNNPGGSVIVNVTEDGNKKQLTVEDTGIGIPIECQSRIFERFYRVDKSHSRSTGGTGLGLSIVKHAVAYHNGDILLTSTLGKGTKITVTFSEE